MAKVCGLLSCSCAKGYRSSIGSRLLVRKGGEYGGGIIPPPPSVICKIFFEKSCLKY